MEKFKISRENSIFRLQKGIINKGEKKQKFKSE